ncbi:FecR family protein [Fibrella aquatica]|uniref:FecR family protein n=1 Tax=Fibrella aquatica TaxID=3242487 RepID=UPI003522CBC1
MNAYHSYTIDDFVQDVCFREWVLSPAPEQDDFWPTWLINHPEQGDAVEQARMIVLGLRVKDISIDHLDVPGAIHRILEDRHIVRPLPVYRRAWFQYAASLILLCGVGVGLWQRFAPATSFSDNQVSAQQILSADKRQFVKLPDGTVVTLEAGSHLEMSNDFGQVNREVTLTGEAFFQVTKDPSKPFLVNTGKIVTRVLGTSFSVKAYESDSRISVSVKTGKVTVSRKEGGQKEGALANEVILTPNQRAVFMSDEEQLIKTLVDKPLLVSPSTLPKSFDFVETPVPNVLKTLSEAYGVEMVYSTDLLANCNLTASLDKQDLYQKLDLICEAIHATYRVVDGRVILTGSGCN